MIHDYNANWKNFYFYFVLLTYSPLLILNKSPPLHWSHRSAGRLSSMSPHCSPAATKVGLSAIGRQAGCGQLQNQTPKGGTLNQLLPSTRDSSVGCNILPDSIHLILQRIPGRIFSCAELHSLALTNYNALIDHDEAPNHQLPP